MGRRITKSQYYTDMQRRADVLGWAEDTWQGRQVWRRSGSRWKTRFYEWRVYLAGSRLIFTSMNPQMRLRWLDELPADDLGALLAAIIFSREEKKEG